MKYQSLFWRENMNTITNTLPNNEYKTLGVKWFPQVSGY